MSDINKLRQEIDKLDLQIIELLSKRIEVTKSVRAYKSENGLPARTNDRWHKLKALHKTRADELGLDYILVEPLFELIHEYVVSNIHKGLPESDK